MFGRTRTEPNLSHEGSFPSLVPIHVRQVQPIINWGLAAPVASVSCDGAAKPQFIPTDSPALFLSRATSFCRTCRHSLSQIGYMCPIPPIELKWVVVVCHTVQIPVATFQ